MILDLDMGNSFLKWRCGDAAGRLMVAELADLSEKGGALCRAWHGLRPQRIRLASVAADELSQQIAAWVQQSWGVTVERAVTRAQQAGVVNSYADPARMGVDRWLAMLAGYRCSPAGCCVVDCGSAITVDFVAADGRHQGGFIMPGVRLMRQGLLGNTQQIRVHDDVRPSTRPGCSTEEAVAHGLQLMVVALAERVVVDSRRLLGEQARLLITGGDGALFMQGAGSGELIPDLVLDGLAIALPGAA